MAHPLIVAVAPDGAGGEAFAVAAGNVSLAGFRITDGEGTLTLPAVEASPSGTWFAAGERWNSMGGPAATLWNQTTRSGRFALAAGDELRLLDPAGNVVDAVAWGNHSVAGMSGSVPHPANVLLMRDRDALPAGPGALTGATAGAWHDTDSAADWITPRAHRFAESSLTPQVFTASHVTLYASPDSSHSTLARIVDGARSRLALHVYELRSATLVDRLVAAAARPGLDMGILVDANPVGMDAGERHATTSALLRLQAAGAQVMLAGNGRYDDVHLKVLVADDVVAVQSENWVDSGVPVDPTVGNRGWGAAAVSPEMADWFWHWMAADRSAWDTTPFNQTGFDPTYAGWDRPAVARTGAYGPIVPALELDGPIRVWPLVAPDMTQDPRSDPLASLIDGATVRVRVQQLDLAEDARNSLGWTSPDPLAASLGRAAARVPVRVQAAAPFGDGPGNRAELAGLGRLGVQTSTMGRPGITTLHNKGLVVDGFVVVGSMNGNHHSRSANREVDLILESQASATYFSGLMASDEDPPGTGRDWGAIGRDAAGIPGAPVPILLVGVLVAARRR